MAEHKEIRLAGYGGQGIILSGILLAEAAGVYDGRYAAQTQSYGPEARGGVSRADVIISDEPIDYPKTRSLDVFLALTTESLEKYLGDVREDGTVIVDSGQVNHLAEDDRLIALPIQEAVLEKIGKQVVTNVACLSVLQALTGVISLEALKKAVQARVPKKFLEMNLQAIEVGQELAKKK
jgi:2-oxoglutarate ferredoxin oxidoreductase subunit gamma